MLLITWNIQWGRGADGAVHLDRIVDHARRLGDFDLLCLQEVADGHPDLPGSDGSDQFAALAGKLLGFEAVAGVAVDTARRPAPLRQHDPQPAAGRAGARDDHAPRAPFDAASGASDHQPLVVEIDTAPA